MKRIVMMAIALSGAGFAVHAQTSAKADSLKVVNLQEVQVVSTRATAKTPVAFTNVRKEQISNCLLYTSGLSLPSHRKQNMNPAFPVGWNISAGWEARSVAGYISLQMKRQPPTCKH